MPASGGLALSGFSQFMSITAPHTFTDAESVINDAQLTNYRTLGYMLRGQRMSRVVQGGSMIQDRIFLAAVRRARSYKPLAQQNYGITQTGKMWQVPWRFFLNDVSWNDETTVLNAGSSMTSKARKEAYKNYWFELMQNMYTDQMAYWEEVLWATPNKATMEAQDGQEMYSILAFLNEHTNGLFNPGSAGAGGVWTTVQGIDPTASDALNWVPTQLTYGQGDTGFTKGNLKNVLNALDRVYMKTDFQPPPLQRQYFEDPMSLDKPGAFIACSLIGRSMVMHVYRESKDRWIDMKDPFQNPTYAGAPFVYIAQLDVATPYAISTTSTGTEQTATVVGPRFYGVQPDYMSTVFHADRYMTNLGIFTEKESPTEHTMPINTFGNLVCRSRKRHFILSPASSQTLP